MPEQPPLTHLLHRWQAGDSGAADLLFRESSHELRRIAGNLFRNERGGHTLQPTAVVNEAFVRLLGLREMEWRDREHFFSFAATAMRRVLVDHARRRNADKRGGEWVRTEIPRSAGVWTDPVDVLLLENALHQLEAIDPERARLVVLRLYSGLSNDEIAELMGVTERTVKRRWQATRAWLRAFIENRATARGEEAERPAEERRGDGGRPAAHGDVGSGDVGSGTGRCSRGGRTPEKPR